MVTGLPKFHKQDVPVRPIVSYVNHAQYNTSKYLAKQFKLTKTFIENTQWWNIQQKREQTTLWTLTNEKCGPTTKAKTEKKQAEEREREGERRVKIR